MKRLLPLALLLAACDGASAPTPDTTKTAPSAAVAPTVAREAYGEAITAASQKVSLKDLVKNPAAYADKLVITEGKVTSVCQGRGCWLELGDESGSAHVKLGGHKFFVPRTSSGKSAIVEAKVLPAVDDGHCEQEAAEQTGRVAKVELLATGVELYAR